MKPILRRTKSNKKRKRVKVRAQPKPISPSVDDNKVRNIYDSDGRLILRGTVSDWRYHVASRRIRDDPWSGRRRGT
jgi:hypothetical protein